MAKIQQLLNKLAHVEQQFQAGEFLAPSLGTGSVHVRVAGVVTKYLLPTRIVGYGLFRSEGSQAVLVRRARLAEQRAYRKLFPARPVILIAHADDGWLAWSAHSGDQRFNQTEAITVHFAEDVQPFDRVHTNFDGSHAWFAGLDDQRDVLTALKLRKALRERTSPDAVSFSGLTPEHRQAYRLAWQLLTGQASVPFPEPMDVFGWSLRDGTM